MLVSLTYSGQLLKGEGMGRRNSYFCGLFAGFMLAMCVASPGANAQVAASGSAASGPAPDMMQLTAEAQTWLTDLIRINTTNPPGNELAAAKYVQNVLQKENIPVEFLEMAPGRDIVVAHLQAGPLPDASRALLLLAHLDVVGVDRAKWSVDPFAGTQKDNYIYGRGAIDDKGMLAANLAAFIELKRSG